MVAPVKTSGMVLDMICCTLSLYTKRGKSTAGPQTAEFFLFADWFHKVVERLLAERQKPQAISNFFLFQTVFVLVSTTLQLKKRRQRLQMVWEVGEIKKLTDIPSRCRFFSRHLR